jgi:hypothetical protein
MGRIEKGENVKEEFQQMKGEVVKEIRRKEGGQAKLTCSVLFFLSLLMFVGWILWVIASTGLITIPLFTNLAYRDPAPERMVIPGVPLETIAKEHVQTVLTRRLQEGGGVLTNTSVELVFSEASFTSTFQSLLESSGYSLFQTDKAQIVLEERGIVEAFLPFAHQTQKTALVAHLRFEFASGGIVVKPERIQLGSFVFPRLLSIFFTDTFVKSQLPALNKSLGQYTQIRSMSYQTGQLTIEGDFDVKVIR